MCQKQGFHAKNVSISETSYHRKREGDKVVEVKVIKTVTNGGGGGGGGGARSKSSTMESNASSSSSSGAAAASEEGGERAQYER